MPIIATKSAAANAHVLTVDRHALASLARKARAHALHGVAERGVLPPIHRHLRSREHEESLDELREAA